MLPNLAPVAPRIPMLLPPDQMTFHPMAEKLVTLLCDKTDNPNRLFFRVIVGYFFCMAAAQMRINIATKGNGDLPVSMFALALGPSGTGKTKSCNIMKNDILGKFKTRFLEKTLPQVAEANLNKLALYRAARDGIDFDDSLLKVQAEYKACGKFLFSFNKATGAGIDQMRHILLMAKAGSVNLQIDEIGSHLLNETEAMASFLELYDLGLMDPRLRLETAVKSRNEEIADRTPTNMLLFGVPNRLFDGGKTEEGFVSLLDTGYARRCFFGSSPRIDSQNQLTPEEVYDRQTSPANDALIDQISEIFENLADPIHMYRNLTISRETSILLIEYKQKCERESAEYSDNQESHAHELYHRYFKVLKLAGAYAFVDESPSVTPDHIHNAIKLAEESGEAFNKMLTRDRNHMKLAKHLANIRCDATQADLVEDLPFYKGTAPARAEMMSLAISHGYRNNIIIKKTISDGIEFFRGETLKETDINKMVVGYSTDITTDYCAEYAPFDQLHVLTQHQGLHWVSHHLTGGYRNEENAIPGFNLVVLDVEGSVSIKAAKETLKDYKFLLHTTKRHTDQENRFRIIMPINYKLALDAKDYKSFMTHIYQWLPFAVDTATNQRSRKWLAHNGSYEYNDGEVLDALPFIPKTSRNEEYKAKYDSQQSMDNLERWVINNIGDGNRNNMLLRFALILVDDNYDHEEIRTRVMALNDKIPDKLPEAEIIGTIMMTTMKALSKR